MALTIGELRVQIDAEIGELRRDLLRAQTSVNRFSTSATRGTAAATRGFSGLGRVLRGLAPLLAAIGIGLGVREFFELADATVNLRNRLRLVTDDAEELENTFGALRVVANSTRVPFDITADLFNRLAISTAELSISQAELVGVTESINQTLAISGATATEASAGLIQFAQGLASGALRGDELRSVLEQLPALARVIATGLGVTVGQLRELGATGALTAEDILGAIQEQAPQIAQQFSQIAPTISSAFTVVRNEILVVVDAINQAFGASEVFAGGILEVSAGLAENLGGAIGVVIQQTATFIRALGAVIDTLENVGLGASALQETFRLLFDVLDVVIQSIQAGFRSIQVGIAAIAVSIQSLGNALGIVSDAALSEGIQDFGEAQNALITSSEEAEAALLNLARGFVEVDSTAGTGPDTRLSDGIASIADSIAASANDVQEAIAQLQGARDRLSDDPGGTGADTAQLKEQEGALKELERIQKRINDEVARERRSRIAARDPLLAQIDDIQQQIVAIRALNLGEADRIRANETIAGLLERQATLDQRRIAASAAAGELRTEIQADLDLGILDEDEARNFGDQLTDLIAEGLSPERLQVELEELQLEIDRAIRDAGESAAPGFADNIGTALQSGLQSAFEGGGADAFLSSFGESLQQTASEALSTAFAESTEDLFGLLSQVLPDSISGLGAGLTGILGGVIGAALSSDPQISSAAANITSAVTSAQQTRGIVAGPTNLAVADVGRSIQDAFLESERLLAIIARNTAPQAASAPGSLGAGDDEVMQTLANEGASLV